MRKPGKGGRRPPKRAKAIPFSMISSGNLPTEPTYVDYLAQLNGGWQVLGNDVAGDCVSVTWANERRLVAGVLLDATFYPNQNQVWQLYQSQNPSFDPNGTADTNGPGSSADNGMDIQTTLEFLHGSGGPDGTKLVAFASVNVHNVDEVKMAIATCGTLWTGVNVYDNNMTEFSESQPWDFTGGTLDGGHSILTAGYGDSNLDTGALGGDEKFITWGEETSFTDRFWASCAEEAWVCIWPEQLGTRAFEQGIDGAALAAVYQQITGQVLVLP